MKFFTLPSGALDELFDKEEEEDDNDEGDVDQEGEEEEEQEELDAYGNPKQSADSSFPSKDYPAGSSVGITRQSGKSKRKQLGKKDLKEDGVRVITLKLDNLFQLSEDDSEKSPKGSKGSSGDIFSQILDQFMVSIIILS